MASRKHLSGVLGEVDPILLEPLCGLSIRLAADCAALRYKIDIGRRSPAFPVTPPGVRVRTGRFGGLSYRPPVNLGIPSESK